MKKILLILLLGLTALTVAAQEDEQPSGNGWRWSLEMGANWDFLQDELPQFDRNKQGWGLYFETRYRIGQTPFDVGLYGSLSNVPRITHTEICAEIQDENGKPIGTLNGYSEGEIKFASWNLMATFDYNHRFGRHCEVFAGAGLGICKYYEGRNWELLSADWYSISDDPHDGISLSLMPRVGVLLFNHLRLTAGYKIQEKANRHAFVSISMVGFFGNHSTTTIE
jgi:opacity protein-like surface antigen